MQWCSALPGILDCVLSCLHGLLGVPNGSHQIHGGVIVGVCLDGISNAEQGGPKIRVLNVLYLHCLSSSFGLHLNKTRQPLSQGLLGLFEGAACASQAV